MARLSKNLLPLVLVVLASIATSTSARAGIMVVVAHPDDDVIIAAGVIQAARLRGEQVNVVYVTNGELVGGPVTGLARQGEAVNAQSFLGVGENALVFLGHPDNRLSDLYSNPAFAEPGAVLTTVHGQSVTFGNRGLGQADYHQHRFGMHASFNKKNFIADLVDVVAKYRPTHVITHADFDVHPDHKTVSIAIREAMKSVAGTDPKYAATLFHGLVWSIDAKGWPLPPNPTTYLTEPPGLAPTGVRWVDRHSIDVPRTMQNTTPELNTKYLAMNAHESQGGSGAFIGKSIHRDEVFWAENPLGKDRPPRVDAGQPLTVAPGAKAQLDGSRSSDLDGPLTFKWTQRDGPPVALAGADTARPSFTAPADIAKDEVLNFALVVSEGGLQSLEDRVSVLVSAGGGPAVASANIAPRAKVTASSAKPGQEAHKVVDEMVGGAPKDPGQEWVSAGERTGAWLQLEWASPFTVDRIVMHDRPGLTDHITKVTLVFDGGVTRGEGPLDNSGAGSAITFPPVSTKTLRVVIDGTSPETTATGLAEIVVYGGATQDGAAVAGASDGNIAALASVSSSSPGGGSIQDATKAVDGVVDGWPNDFSKEWVTAGERSGAWLLLEWSDEHVIDRVVLHDRVNPSDNIANATLVFDDGPPIRTGALPANGTAREVKFPPVSARKLRIALTTSAGTQNAGLAELKVYESKLPPAARTADSGSRRRR
ncbi:MAG: PIG-L family deacetylase [Myxococcota bacterium]